MPSGFRQQSPGLIPDATKDLSSKCGVRAHKIRGSESPILGRQHFIMGVISGENFPSLPETYQNCGDGDGWC